MAQALIGCIGGALTAEDPKYCARDFVGRVCEHLGCSEPGNHVIRTVLQQKKDKVPEKAWAWVTFSLESFKV